MDMLDIYLYMELSLLLFNGTEAPWPERYITSATPTKQALSEGTPVFTVSPDTQPHLVNAYSYGKEGVPKTYSNPNSRESRQFE